MMDFLQYLHGALAVAGMISVICRLKTMSKATKATVRWQHGFLFAGLLWSLVVPREFAALPVLLAVFVFLMLSADRWKKGPPSGTTKPMPLEPLQWNEIGGGKR